MCFITCFMGRQQPGSARRSESACARQVWSRQEGSSHEGWPWAGVQAREVQWGCPLEHQVLLILAPAGHNHSWNLRCRELQLLLLPCSPVEQLQLTWSSLSTAQHIPSPSSGWGEEWLRAGTICFFHWKWFIGRNCWRAGDLLLINNSKHTVLYNDQSL